MFIKFPLNGGNFFMSNKFKKLKKRISNLTERKKGNQLYFSQLPLVVTSAGLLLLKRFKM